MMLGMAEEYSIAGAGKPQSAIAASSHSGTSSAHPEEAVEVDTWVGMVVGMISAAAASSWLLLWALLIFCRQREMLWSMKLAHTKITEYWEKLCNAARKRHCF
jgi:hypothetical protein